MSVAARRAPVPEHLGKEKDRDNLSSHEAGERRIAARCPARTHGHAWEERGCPGSPPAHARPAGDTERAERSPAPPRGQGPARPGRRGAGEAGGDRRNCAFGAAQPGKTRCVDGGIFSP